MKVEVVYASPELQVLETLHVEEGLTVAEVVALSRIAERLPGVDVSSCALGVFGKVVDEPASRRVVDGDRIELYRPLLADPKEVRKRRAAMAAAARNA